MNSYSVVLIQENAFMKVKNKYLHGKIWLYHPLETPQPVLSYIDFLSNTS
jgi:hypothetical protein